MRPIAIFALLLLSTIGFGQSKFYLSSDFQDVRITFEQDNWKYLLDSLRYNGDELLSATVRVNNGEILEDAAVRYRDGRSFTPNGRRNGLFIDLGGPRNFGYRYIDLSSALRDPSMIRDVLAREIAGTYMPTPQANFVKVYINNQYYGFFVNQEPADGAFLQQHFGSSDRTLIYANPDFGNSPPEGCSSKSYGSLQFEKNPDCTEYNFDLLQGVEFDPIYELANALQEGGQNIENVLNVDAALWMLAVNNVLVNLNSYSGQYATNYYLYWDGNSRFQPILGDLNLAFGSFKNSGVSASDLRTPELLQLPVDLHKQGEARPLVHTLLANEMYYKQYLAHIRTILTEWVLSGKLENRALALQEMISDEVKLDQNKYYTNADFARSLTEVIGQRSRIPGLVSFMNKRGNWLSSQDVYTVLPPVIKEVGIVGRERFSSERITDFRLFAQVEGFAKQAYIYYQQKPGLPFTMTKMYDDGEHNDGEANDGRFGVSITPQEGQSTLRYYIFVENAKTAMFSPSNYNFEQFETSMSEMNK